MKTLLWSATGLLAVTVAVYANERDEKLAQPGPEHRELSPLVGTWRVSGTCYKEENKPESVSGTVTSEWVLGDRFVKCTARMTEGSKSSEGMGTTGYNNAQRKYETSWQDTNCTSIKMETGDFDKGSKTFTFTGDFKDPDGKPMRCRKVIKIVSDREHTMTGYLTEAGKPERKVAELTFTKA